MDLEEIFKEVESADITDPTCMDWVLIRLEDIEAEDEEFMKLLLDRLDDFVITWEQPWYQEGNSLTRAFKKVELENKDCFRTDTICEEENERILKNWRKFIKKYKLPDKLICLARWRNKDRSRNPSAPEERARHFVTAYLSQGLKRNLCQVYKHITRRFLGPNRGLYNEIEEKIIEICFHHCPRKAVPYLSTVLGREPRGIYKRLAHMYNGKPERKKIKWNLQLATKLVKQLMDHTNLTLEELKNNKLDKSVWLKIGKEFDHPYPYLQAYWYAGLHPQLFTKYDVKIKRLRKHLLRIISNSSYRLWSDIRWKQIVTHFPDSFTHIFLYKLLYRFLCKYPHFMKAPIQDLVNYGLEKLKSDQKKRLRTLTLDEHGDLKEIKYDVKWKRKSQEN